MTILVFVKCINPMISGSGNECVWAHTLKWKSNASILSLLTCDNDNVSICHM